MRRSWIVFCKNFMNYMYGACTVNAVVGVLLICRQLSGFISFLFPCQSPGSSSWPSTAWSTHNGWTKKLVTAVLLHFFQPGDRCGHQWEELRQGRRQSGYSIYVVHVWRSSSWFTCTCVFCCDCILYVYDYLFLHLAWQASVWLNCCLDFKLPIVILVSYFLQME